jgi:hypothetical protein
VSRTVQTRIRFCVLMVAACVAVSPLRGQETTDIAPGPSVRFPAAWYPPDNDVTSTMAPVKGAPYEARVVMSSEQYGKVPVEQATLQARDATGRTRTESSMGPRTTQDGRQVQVREVSISDPVSHCSFQWEEPWGAAGMPRATVQCMPRTVHFNEQSMWSSVASIKPGEEHPSPDETDQTEAIGGRTFDGIRAVGFRRVRILKSPDPKQTQTIESEVWTAPEMKEIVAIYVKGPGGYGIELRDIKLREPDPKLFYPPANYKIEPIPSHP